MEKSRRPRDVRPESADDVSDAERRDRVIAAGLPPTRKNIAEWGGLSAREILKAIDRGFPSAEHYRKFRMVVDDYSQIERVPSWQIRLRQVGFSRSAAKKIDEVHRLAPESAVRWLEAGLTETQLLEWLATDYEWTSSAVRTREVMRWAAAGHAPADRREWIAADLSIDDAEICSSLGLDLVSAQEWMSAGVSLAAVGEWMAAGVETPGDVAAWMSYGLDAFAVADWRAAGLEQPEEVAVWSADFSPWEAARWIAAGVTHRAATRRAAAGIRPPGV